MNLILLETEDFVSEDRVRLWDRRLRHVRTIHRAKEGDELRVGRVDGAMGVGRVITLNAEMLELEIHLDEAPPPPSEVTLAVALPRPPTLQKVLQHCTALGIKRFDFFHARRTEKSYWQSSALEETSLRDHMILGLEQARDTRLPDLHFHHRFRPFAEDLLAERSRSEPVMVADPSAPTRCPHALAGALTLVLGPEGGFVPFEVELMGALGFELVSLGPRILRVEVAALALLSRLSP